ncbi:Low molecular weight phosphotyrosine protein phosphatase [Dimargaris cristalligena]|nr:Low molecular weight phosphotyrosine protein phosphatase [Dimargaris cristalligena]
MTTGVLFVCLGNICRSPMAEAVFAHTVDSKGMSDQFNIDSAGTAAYHTGEVPDQRSTDTCVKHGVKVKHLARQVTKADFHDFDYILCMDQSNLQDLTKMQPKNIHMFGEFDPQGEKIIADPYYGKVKAFEHNFAQVSRCSEGFLQHLGLGNA